MRRFWRQYVNRFILGAFESGLAYILPLVEVKIIDDGIGNKNLHNLLVYVGVFFLAAIVIRLISFLSSIYCLRVNKMIELDLQQRVISYFMNCDAWTLQKYDHGEIDNIIKSDTRDFKSVSDSLFVSIATNITEIVVAIVIMFSASVPLSCMVILLQIINLWVFKLRKTELKFQGEELRNKSIIRNRMLVDIIRNIHVIRLMNANDFLFKRYKDSTKDFLKQQQKAFFTSEKIDILTNIISSLMNASMYLVVGILVIKGYTTVGFLIGFTQYSAKLVSPITSIISEFSEFIHNYKSITNVADILQLVQKKKPSLMSMKSEDIKKITIENVSFSYDSENKVLDNVSASFAKDRINYIVGTSGSGKSTLLNLILGRYIPDKGTIRFNDTSASELGDINQLISWMPQEQVIFTDTVLANLTLGKEIPIEQVEKVCKECQIYEDITNMEDGFNSVFTDNAEQLSGGQKQRLALARTILQNKPIVVLDEVTSALDAETESLIKDVLIKMSKEKIVIVVTHSMQLIDKNASILKLSSI